MAINVNVKKVAEVAEKVAIGISAAAGATVLGQKTVEFVGKAKENYKKKLAEKKAEKDQTLAEAEAENDATEEAIRAAEELVDDTSDEKAE